MISEDKFETINGLAVRVGAPVTAEALLCFSSKLGGDILLEPGDEVTVIVFNRQKKVKPAKKQTGKNIKPQKN
jgi:hypothetical protein